MISNKRIFVVLTIVFIIMTVIGTLSHELGHYTVAKLLGHTASVHYGSTRSSDSVTDARIYELDSIYRNEIEHGAHFEKQDEYYEFLHKQETDDFLVILGGPAQTILTGTIGFCLLGWRRRKVCNDPVTMEGWILIFLSLFWLRQLANLASVLAVFAVTGQIEFNGDEFVLAYYLDIPGWTIQIVTACFAAWILFFVLRSLPRRVRSTFIYAGIAGGIIGYLLWFKFLGPWLVP